MAPTPPLVNITGTVWIHESGGARPFAGAQVHGWVEETGRGGPIPRATADVSGRYVFQAQLNSLVKVLVAEAHHQPCAVTIRAAGDAARDVHVVADPSMLGARLPPELLAQPPILSGVVFEETAEGRQAVGGVLIGWDTTGGADLALASTLTDSTGRYVLCNLDPGMPALVTAHKDGYAEAAADIVLRGPATTLDLPMRRLAGRLDSTTKEH